MRGVRWRKVTLVGVGLLGGSLGLALRARGLANRVAGYVRRPESIQECLGCGVADEVGTDLAQAVEGADLVVLCTPVGQMPGLVSRFLPSLEAGTILTDVGSVKEGLVAELNRLTARSGVRYVGSHPMAGSERTGVAAAREDLYSGAVCVVTPSTETDPRAVEAVAELWSALGSRVVRLRPDLHDLYVARSSHLPHVMAAAVVHQVLGPDQPADQANLCAGGFRDTTRIASGSPEMWRDIVLANRGALGRALGSAVRDLEDFRAALAANDAEAVEVFFTGAKQARDSWAHHLSARCLAENQAQGGPRAEGDA